jgi:hypothetical protein
MQVSKISEKGELKKAVLRALRETLDELFGVNSAKIIYHYLTRNVRSEDPESFIKEVVLMLTVDSASEIIERRVLEKVYSENGLHFEVKSGYSFNDYLNDIRNRMKENPVRRQSANSE